MQLLSKGKPTRNYLEKRQRVSARDNSSKRHRVYNVYASILLISQPRTPHIGSGPIKTVPSATVALHGNQPNARLTQPPSMWLFRVPGKKSSERARPGETSSRLSRSLDPSTTPLNPISHLDAPVTVLYRIFDRPHVPLLEFADDIPLRRA